MISPRDIYADKHGRITEIPEEFAIQVAVKGCQLDERVARRFGITDTLVSTTEPHAMRRVTGRNASSVRIIKAAETTEAKPQEQPQEPAEADEPKAAEETKTEADKPTAKKEK